MTDLSELQNELHQFSLDRDWKQFHNPKDLAISLVLEATEVLEHFQWKNSDEIVQYLKSSKNEVSAELADTFYWLLVLSHDLEIDLIGALEAKMKHNAEKYPIEKSKGNHKKYTELSK